MHRFYKIDWEEFIKLKNEYLIMRTEDFGEKYKISNKEIINIFGKKKDMWIEKRGRKIKLIKVEQKKIIITPPDYEYYRKDWWEIVQQTKNIDFKLLKFK